MKPNYRTFLKVGFPSLIMLHAAHAAVINPDAAGNIAVPGNFDEINGTAFTAQANSAVATPKTVTIASSAILEGDPVIQDAVRITTAGYSVTNAGSISGNLHGIGAGGITTSVTNSGSIRGITLEGILANGGGTISNTGSIQGLTAGIRFQSANGIVNNAGTISGQTGIGAAGFTTTVTNSGTITGTSADAVIVGGGSTVTNGNQINGFTNGVRFDTAGGTLTNNGNITASSTGAASGVNAVSGLNLVNNGSISGTTGITVTGGGSTITNNNYIGSSPVTGNAINLGANGNSIILSSNSFVEGNIAAAGTGNSITANAGRVLGNITGVQTINVTSGGSLQVNGNIAATSTINAASDSIIAGTGTWTSTVNLAGGSVIEAYSNTDPDGDSGILNINGNVNHVAGSSVAVVINPELTVKNDGTNASLIRSIGGTYNAATATVDLYSSGDWAVRNGNYDLVQDAGGTVNGGNNTVTYQGRTDTVLGNYFVTTALNPSGSLVGVTTHNFAALPGLTSNESSLGGALDAFMHSETGLADGVTNNLILRSLIGGMDKDNLAYSQWVLNLLVSPAENAIGLAESTVNSNYRVHRQIEDHLSGARNEGEETTTTRTIGEATRDAKGGIVSAAQTVTEVSGGGKGNLWGSYSGDHQDFNGFGAGDFDGDVNAFTVGIDFRVAPNLILGILADGSKADLDSNMGDTETESIRGAIYGTWGASTGVYSDFLVGYGSHDLDFTDAESLQALLTIGYAFGGEHLKHGPFIGAEYQKVEVDGFKYDLVTPVDVHDFDAKSFRGLVGYRLEGEFGRFKPYASVAYAHEFEDDATEAKASISGFPFRVKGSDRSSAVLVTAGFGIGLTNSLNLDLGYRGEYSVDDEGIDSNGGTVGLNYRF